jgi:hypothetical protein
MLVPCISVKLLLEQYLVTTAQISIDLMVEQSQQDREQASRYLQLNMSSQYFIPIITWPRKQLETRLRPDSCSGRNQGPV